jgi:hypothetical protein
MSSFSSCYPFAFESEIVPVIVPVASSMEKGQWMELRVKRVLQTKEI